MRTKARGASAVWAFVDGDDVGESGEKALKKSQI